MVSLKPTDPATDELALYRFQVTYCFPAHRGQYVLKALPIPGSL
jgi:hypothetical protein